ncbi:MAG: mannosyltransferase family protein [Nitrososphaerota archaeon]|nr:hypothetical protein [Candidatus Bathyarchaeota archaeon]MDW8049288.1 mannosyltransferase family protein [Nitrososphaerota archaeon]
MQGSRLSGLLGRVRLRVKPEPYGVGAALLLALASRVFVVLNAVLGSYFLPIINPNAWDTGLPVLNLFARWDAGHYFRIAQYGYDETNVGSFPLLPCLLWLFSAPLSPFMPRLWSLNIIGFFLSNLFFFISVLGLYRLTYKVFDGDERVAFYSALFLSFYPTSVFMSAVYAESLLMAFALWSFIMLERGRFVVASVLAFLAGLSRPIGFLASLPMLLAGLKDRSIKIVVLSALSASSILVFDVYRYMVMGKFYAITMPYDLLMSILSGRSPLTTSILSNSIQVNAALKIISALLIALALASYVNAASLRKGSRYLVYSIIIFVVYLFYSSALGFVRYSITILTIYWLMGSLSANNRTLGTIMLCGACMLLGLLTVVYTNWYELC